MILRKKMLIYDHKKSYEDPCKILGVKSLSSSPKNSAFLRQLKKSYCSTLNMRGSNTFDKQMHQSILPDNEFEKKSFHNFIT